MWQRMAVPVWGWLGLKGDELFLPEMCRDRMWRRKETLGYMVVIESQDQCLAPRSQLMRMVTILWTWKWELTLGIDIQDKIKRYGGVLVYMYAFDLLVFGTCVAMYGTHMSVYIICGGQGTTVVLPSCGSCQDCRQLPFPGPCTSILITALCIAAKRGKQPKLP